MINVDIYIDGSCSGNPGPIGFAAVCPINGKILAKSGFDTAVTSTNNRAELRGAILALDCLRRKGCKVTLYTDSNYLMSFMNHNAEWFYAEGRPNRELWIQFITKIEQGKHAVKMIKVKGHDGNKYNEIADRKAREACVKAKHALTKGR